MAAQIYPVTMLDAAQVMQYVYDESTQALRTTALATIVGGDLIVDIDGVYNASTNPDPDNIGLIAHNRSLTPSDTDQTIRITSVSNLDVHALDVSIHQSDGSEIDSLNPLPITGIVVTSPDVNIHDAAGNNLTSQLNGAQRALDVGVNVAGVQVDPRQIRALTAVDVVTVQQGTSPWVENVSQFGGSPVVTGTGNSGAGIPRVTVSNDSSITNITGTISLPTGAATESTLTTRLADATFTSRINTLGQKTMDNSTPVVLASDQTVIPVSDNGGSLTVDQPTASNFNAQVVGNIADAATDSGNPVKVGGIYNTTAPTYTNGQRGNLQLDRKGAVLVNTEGLKRTYSACISVLTVAASTTDFFTITGAANTVVRIESIILSGEATANQIPEIILLKRSTANTGGTSTTLTAVPHDSNDAAATATVRAYTANPTTGTLVGNLRALDLFLSGASGNPAQMWEIRFNEKSGKCPRLNSASEVIALNLAGVTLAGANFAISITWTEE